MLRYCTERVERNEELPLLQKVFSAISRVGARAVRHEGIRVGLQEWLPLLSRTGRIRELRSYTLLLVRVLVSEMQPSIFAEEGRQALLPSYCDPALHLWVNAFWGEQVLCIFGSSAPRWTALHSPYVPRDVALSPPPPPFGLLAAAIRGSGSHV